MQPPHDSAHVPVMRYEYTAIYLSEMPQEKIGVACARCGMRKRYDRLRLLERAGDHPMPDLIRRIAGAEGCERAYSMNRFSDPCRLKYSPAIEETPEEAKARERRRRLTQR